MEENKRKKTNGNKFRFILTAKFLFAKDIPTRKLCSTRFLSQKNISECEHPKLSQNHCVS